MYDLRFYDSYNASSAFLKKQLSALNTYQAEQYIRWQVADNIETKQDVLISRHTAYHYPVTTIMSKIAKF